MQDNQLNYRLALWLIPEIGLVVQKTLLQQFPNLEEFFALPRFELKKMGFSDTCITHLNQPDWKKVEAMLAWAQKPQHHLLTILDAAYPENLRQIYSAPTVLFAKGDIHLLQHSQLAIVGSRNPTPAGLQIAKQYAEFLATQGLVITSGLASGIDGMAHQSVLEVSGKTIAVIGTGCDVIYPKHHTGLTEKIINNGLLISEFPLGTPPQPLNFPQRNRIISGLSLGTFVVEASIRSGSLITARYALEQGREVFAMPSSVHNPMAKGCHWLIKQGATLVESVEDIWQQIQQQHLNLATSRPPSNQTKNRIPLDFTQTNPHISKQLTELQHRLLNVMGFDRWNIETLSQQISLNIEQLSVVLLELELLGCIEAVPGGYQRANIRGP